MVEELKRWPFFRIAFPAVLHYVIYGLRAVDILRLWHPVTSLDQFDDFSIMHAC